MFVRWKRRPLTAGKRPTGEVVKAAVLVRSVRTEAGPRLRHLCYLGSIREGFEDYPAHQAGFWEAAERGLARAGVVGADRERIVAALEQAVPRPDPAGLAAEEAALAELASQLNGGVVP
jgi:hypothetical protein